MKKNYTAEIHIKQDALYTPQYVFVDEAASYIGCTSRRVRAMLSTGRLSGWKVGKLWKVKFPLLLTVGTRGPMPKLSRQRIPVRSKQVYL